MRPQGDSIRQNGTQNLGHSRIKIRLPNDRNEPLSKIIGQDRRDDEDFDEFNDKELLVF
jgi:hypothetical protein